MEVKTILGKQELSKTDLVALLDCRDTTEAELFRIADSFGMRP